MSHSHTSEDMPMSSSTSSSSMMMMTPYLHFSGGDSLYFKVIAPSSKGAIAGAAIFLFFFAAFERFIVAMRSAMEARWRQRAKALVEQQAFVSAEKSDDGKTNEVYISPPSTSRKRVIPPFIWSHDVSRGVMQALQSFFHFALMLAIMTFQAAYIITIIAGLGAGEIVFGRLVLDFSSHTH